MSRWEVVVDVWGAATEELSHELLDDIRNIADREEVIPLSIASLLAEASDRHRIKARNIEKEGTNFRSDLSEAEVLRLAVELRTKTLECRKEDLSEASWNSFQLLGPCTARNLH